MSKTGSLSLQSIGMYSRGQVAVNSQTMALHVNGEESEQQIHMLHDSPWMTSEYGSGRITIHTLQGSITFSNAKLRPPE